MPAHLQLGSHILNLCIANIRAVQKGKQEQHSQPRKQIRPESSMYVVLETYGGSILRSTFRNSFFSAMGSTKTPVSEPDTGAISKCSIECFFVVSFIMGRWLYRENRQGEIWRKGGCMHGRYISRGKEDRDVPTRKYPCTIPIWSIRG